MEATETISTGDSIKTALQFYRKNEDGTVDLLWEGINSITKIGRQMLAKAIAGSATGHIDELVLTTATIADNALAVYSNFATNKQSLSLSLEPTYTSTSTYTYNKVTFAFTGTINIGSSLTFIKAGLANQAAALLFNCATVNLPVTANTPLTIMALWTIEFVNPQ